MLRFKHLFTPPIFPGDEIKTRRAAIIDAALLTIMLFTLIASLGDWLGGNTPPVVIINNLAGFGVASALRVWLHRGHVRSAGIVLLGLTLFSTTLAIVMLGTIRTPTTAAFIAYVVGAGIVFGLPGIIFTAVASSLIVLGLIVAENAGVLPPPDYTVTITQWIAYTGLFMLTGGLTYVATNSLHHALRRADNEIAERKRIYAELQRRNRELLLLNRASQTLTSSLDLDEILTRLLQEVDSLFNAVGAFWLLEPNGDTLVCRQASGPASEQVRGWRLRLGEGIAGWVAQTDESVVVPDALTDDRHFKDVSEKTGLTARSILCVPLKTQDRVVGVLQVMDTQPQRFDTTHLLLAEFLAATAASAIENAQLYMASQQTTQALRESENRYRTLFENLPIPVFTKDLAGRYTSCNNENLRYWTVNPVGHTDAELLPPHLAEMFRRNDQRVITDGVPLLTEEHIDAPFGARVVLSFKVPLRDSAGNIAGILGASMDITEHKRLEQELEQERDFALRVMEAMGQGLAITDASGHFEYVNPAYLQMLGRPIDQVLGKTSYDFHHPDDHAKLTRGREERTQGKTTLTEVRLLKADGSIVPVLITGAPRMQDGKFIGTITVITDLTESKKMEHALKAERDFALRVMNTMGQGLTITDREGHFEFVNPAYAQMMGYTPEELLGKTPTDVTVDEDLAGLERARAQRKLGKTNTYESRLVRKDGSIIPVLITGVPRVDSGEYAGAIAVITDLTEQKRTEEHLRFLGTHDTLTGIYNRAFFEEELERLKRSREFPISVVVIDVDDMKTINDTQGHAAGDELLKRTAHVLQSSFRAADILARIGGDEFAVLLPSTDEAVAALVLNRVREKLAEHNQCCPDAPVRLSIGVATATHGDLLEAFKLADARMYEDKRIRKM